MRPRKINLGMKRSRVSAFANFVASLLSLSFVSTTANAEIKTSVYGFLKGDSIYTTREFSQDHRPWAVLSETGITADASALRQKSRVQFSAKQSRFGLKFDSPANFTGKVEIDFDGEVGNTPGMTLSDSGIIRIRQANFSVPVFEDGILTVGKKQELFSPLAPHSYQYTSIHLFSGNVGILTDGAEYLHKFDQTTVGVELKNVGGDKDTIKLSPPALTLRVDTQVSQHKFGACYIVGKLNYAVQDVTSPLEDRDAEISGTNLYYNGTFDQLDVIGEVYSGANLGSGVVGALAQAKKSEAASGRRNEEFGYYVSLKQKMNGYSIFGGYGLAKFRDNAAAPANSFQSLVQNSLARIGVDSPINPDVTVFLEASAMASTYFENGRDRLYDGQFYNLGLVAKF